MLQAILALLLVAALVVWPRIWRWVRGAQEPTLCPTRAVSVADAARTALVADKNNLGALLTSIAAETGFELSDQLKHILIDAELRFRSGGPMKTNELELSTRFNRFMSTCSDTPAMLTNEEEIETVFRLLRPSVPDLLSGLGLLKVSPLAKVYVVLTVLRQKVFPEYAGPAQWVRSILERQRINAVSTSPGHCVLRGAQLSVDNLEVRRRIEVALNDVRFTEELARVFL